jgi:hypothetical protein
MVATDKDISDVLATALQQAGEITLPAYGFSMGGELARADALVISSASRHTIRWGSIVVFRRFDRWIAHRVIWMFGRRSPWLCVTKGDAVRAHDSPFVARQDVVGVVTAFRRGERVESLTGRGARIFGYGAALTGLGTALAAAALRKLRPIKPAPR